MRSKLPSFIDVVVDGENHFELRRPNKEDKAGVMYYLVEDRKTHQLRQGMKQTIESIKDDTDRTWHNVLHDDTWCAWKLTRTGFDDLVLGIVVFSWHGMFPRSVKGGKEKSSCEDIAPAADDEFSHAMVALGTGRAQSHWYHEFTIIDIKLRNGKIGVGRTALRLAVEALEGCRDAPIFAAIGSEAGIRAFDSLGFRAIRQSSSSGDELEREEAWRIRCRPEHHGKSHISHAGDCHHHKAVTSTSS